METQNGRSDFPPSSSGKLLSTVMDLIKNEADVNQGCDEMDTTALHVCCESGHLDMVQLLIMRGAKVNCRRRDGMTPLHGAVRGNHVTIVRCLLDNGADHTISDRTGHTPLTLALNLGNKIISSVLINHADGLKKNFWNDHRERKVSPLHAAVRRDDVDAVSRILNKFKADDNGEAPEVFYSRLHEPSRNGFTPLHSAAQYNSKETAKLLIGCGANVNFPAKHSVTPLHVASRWGNADMVNLFLDEYAVIECSSKDKLTPLHCACRNGHTEVANILLCRGATVLAKTKSLLSPLHLAVQGDHVPTCELLLHYFANIDDVTCDFLTPLHVGAHCGSYNSVKFLLNSGCFVEAKAKNGFTALHVACRKNRKRIVELLLRFNAHVEAASEAGLTSLHVSSFLGHLDIVRILLDAGAHIDCRNSRLESPIHLATRGGNVKVVELLLDRGANVNSQAKELQTPLHVASHSSHLGLMDLLIARGASIDPLTKDGYTPLHMAAAQDNEEAILCLLRHGADANRLTKRGFSPLHVSCKYNKKRSTRMLLAGGCDPNVRGLNELTPLLLASHYGYHDVTKLLLKYGADVGLTALNGYTGLHIAAKRKKLRIAEELLRWGADVNSRSKNGFTPLHIASREGHELMVQLLLVQRAEVNCSSKIGLTPLHLAARENHVGVAKLLVLYKAIIDPQTLSGHTPLHTACHFGQLEMINFLLSHDADPNIQNKHGFSPLHQAAQEGHVTVINILLKFKANPNLLTCSGRSAFSVAHHLNYVAASEALLKVTDKYVTGLQGDDDDDDGVGDDYDPSVPETMQECDITYLYDTYDGKDLYSQIDNIAYDIAPSLKKNTDQWMPEDGKVEKCDHHSLDFMVDERVIADELRYTSEPLHAPFNSTPLPDLSKDCPFIGAQFSECLEFKADEYSTCLTFPNKGTKNKKSGLLRRLRGKSEPSVSMARELTCELMHPSELPNLPLLAEDQALASWVLRCRPAGKTFSRAVSIIVPHLASLMDGEREIGVYKSNNGLDWMEHSQQQQEHEKDCLAVLKPTFRGVNLKNDLYSKHLVGITITTVPCYLLLVSRVSESHLPVHLPGFILRPPSVKHPVFLTIGQHACNDDDDMPSITMAAQQVPHEFIMRMKNSVTCSPCVTIKPVNEVFKCPVTLTLSCFNLLTSADDQLKLYVSKFDSDWFDLTNETQFSMNESNTVVTFDIREGGRYIVTNGPTDETSLRSVTSQLNLVPFYAKFILLCRLSTSNLGCLEFDVFCGTCDVIDGFIEEGINLKKIELFRSDEIEVYHNTFQVFTLEGSHFEVCDDSPDCVLFQAFQRNCVTVMAKITDHHLLEKEDSLFLELFRGVVSISSLIPTDDQVFYTSPLCQSAFSFTKNDDVDRVLWYPFIGPSPVPHREQLPPIANYCPSNQHMPIKINFDEYSNTMTVPKKCEVIKYDYQEKIITEPSTKHSETTSDDGSTIRIETSITSTFRLLYKSQEGSDSRELVEKRLCGMEILETVSKFPPGLKADDIETKSLKFISSERNVVESDENGIPVQKKIITRIFQAPKPKVTKAVTEGETYAETSFDEDFKILQNGSAVKSKRSRTRYLKQMTENTFVNGVLKKCRKEDKTVKNEIENYSLELPNHALIPKLGMCTIDLTFNKSTERKHEVDEITGDLMVVVVPQVDLTRVDGDSQFEKKPTKVDMIIKGPVECKVEKFSENTISDSGAFVKMERAILTYVMPCYEVRMVVLAEKKRVVSEEILMVEVIENIIELPPSYRNLDFDQYSFETKASFSEEALKSGVTYRKKTFVTKLISKSNQNVSNFSGSELVCPNETLTKITGMDKYHDVDDVFEFNRTIETSLVQPIANFTYNRDAVPAIVLKHKYIETDVRDVFLKLECGNIERHAGNCDVSVVVVPNASPDLTSLKRVVFDVKLKPRVVTKRTEGEIQIKNRMEDYVKISQDGSFKSHHKVIVSEHFKPITIVTQIDGKVDQIQKLEQLTLTKVKENIFEMPILGLDIAGSDISISTSEGAPTNADSDSCIHKTTTKISLVPPSVTKDFLGDKCREPEIVKEEFDFEDIALDGTINKHLVTIETMVARHQDDDKLEVIEQKITEKVLEIPPEVADIDDSKLCTRTTDSWVRDTTSTGAPRTKHVIRTRLCKKSNNFDYDPVARNKKFHEELEGDIQMKMDVQEFEKFTNDAKTKHKIITRKFLKPITTVKYAADKKIPEITVREDLIKVEIEEYAMELDDNLCSPDDCTSTIDNYTYVNYLPNGIPVNTEVTKVTAKLKKDKNKLELLPESNVNEKHIKQRVSLVENQEQLADGGIVKTKVMTKDCFEVLKKTNARGESTVSETLLKTDIKEFIMILPKAKIDIYGSNCNCEITSEFNRISKKGEPTITKLTVRATVSLKSDCKQQQQSLSYNEISKYLFGVKYGDVVRKEIVEYEEQSNESCIERIRKFIVVKSRPFYALTPDDDNIEKRTLSGSRTEEIETIDCRLECLSEEANLGYELAEIKSCTSEENNYYEFGIFNKVLKILCTMGKADSEFVKRSWVLEEKIEKRVEVLKEEDELCPDGSLKRSITFAHKYFKIINTVKLSPKFHLELETSEKLVECNLVVVDVTIYPCTLKDEGDFNVEMKTSNDWEEVADKTKSQHIEMSLLGSPEFTFQDAKLSRSSSENEKETFLSDGTLVKWKTLISQTFLTCTKRLEQENETKKNQHKILLKTNIFIALVEIGPEVVIDETKNEFESLLSKDSTYLLMPDGSLCCKNAAKFVLKKSKGNSKLTVQQSGNKKISHKNTKETLEDGSVAYKCVSVASTIRPYYRIAEDQQLMLNEDVLDNEIQEVVLCLKPEISFGNPLTYTVHDRVEITDKQKIKRRVIKLGNGSECTKIDDNRILTICGNLELEDNETEQEFDSPGHISKTKTWNKTLFKCITDIQSDKNNESPIITSRKLEVYRESYLAHVRVPLGSLNSKKCNVFITFGNVEHHDEKTCVQEVRANVEVSILSDSQLTESGKALVLPKTKVTTDSNESGTQCRKSEVITTEVLPDGSLGRKKIITTTFYKKRWETVCVDGIETSCKEEEIPVGTTEEIHLLHLPFGANDVDSNDWDTEVTEVRDEGEKQLDGLNMKYRTTHLKLIPRAGHMTGADETTQEVFEGEIQTKADISESQEALEDGSILKKKVITTCFYKPVTKTISKNGKVVSSSISEHTVSMEVEEIYLQLPPGHIEPFGNNLITETTILHNDEMLIDRIPSRKKIIKMRVTLQDSEAQSLTASAQTDAPYELDSNKRIEGELISSTNFLERSSTNEDGEMVICKTTTTRFFRPVAEITISNGRILNALINEETTHFDICDAITILSPGVDSLSDSSVITVSTEDVFNEKNQEGIPILRTVRTNKLFKVMGASKTIAPQDNENLKSLFPQLFLEEKEIGDSIKIFSQTVENEPVKNTKIQEFVDILPDGTKVKRRVTETVEKRSIIRRLAIEGEDGARVTKGMFLHGIHPIPESEENHAAEQELSGPEDADFPFLGSSAIKKRSGTSTQKKFVSETSFTFAKDLIEANEFFES